MIYGIKIEELFSEGCTISSDTFNVIHQMIPDVVDKCTKFTLWKKSNSSLHCWKLFKKMR